MNEKRVAKLGGKIYKQIVKAEPTLEEMIHVIGAMKAFGALVGGKLGLGKAGKAAKTGKAARAAGKAGGWARARRWGLRGLILYLLGKTAYDGIKMDESGVDVKRTGREMFSLGDAWQSIQSGWDWMTGSNQTSISGKMQQDAAQKQRQAADQNLQAAKMNQEAAKMNRDAAQMNDNGTAYALPPSPIPQVEMLP